MSLADPVAQRTIAFGLVGLAALDVARRLFRRYGAARLAQWLLKKGRIKWAMRVRRFGGG